MPAPEELTRDELIVLAGTQVDQLAVRDARVAAQDEQIAARDRQIAAMATQISGLMEANEALGDRLAKLEHLLSRNSKNSSSPPSKDDDPGKTPPAATAKRGGGPKRKKGKQPGAPGANLGWAESPDDHKDRFPEGLCECGHDLAGARDLGVVDRYQQHEIPQVSVSITQYDQHSVRCGCGRVHAAARPEAPAPEVSSTARTCKVSRRI